jgi:hypothetical protein
MLTVLVWSMTDGATALLGRHLAVSFQCSYSLPSLPVSYD